MGFMQGKRVLVVGLASNRSIAWGIANAMHREGAELAFTYQSEKLQSRVEKMAKAFGSDLVCPCDVSSDEEINGVFNYLDQHWSDGFDVVVHSVAFAPNGQLEGLMVDDATREGFRVAHDISAFSFIALAQGARSRLRAGGSMLTMSYLGAIRAVPHYNVMGLAKASLEASVRYLASDLGPSNIRVNAISAGPIKTLAAKGISDFGKLLEYGEKNSPLRRNVTIDEVGNASAFICSDLASGISGEVLYVDSGYHLMAMAVPE